MYCATSVRRFTGLNAVDVLVMETMEDGQAVPGRRIFDIEVGVVKDMLVRYHVDPTMPL